jgi:hypothetical protein
VVVVAINGEQDTAATRILSSAREHATELLVVCGDPQRINSALGAGV